jgi:1,4-dihydroxy-2-naphthoyl-CoA hydrolase
MPYLAGKNTMRILPKLNVDISLDALNDRCKNTMASHLGILFTEIDENYLRATMPVDERTFQPLKMLNGGASLALAETLGSMAANLVLDRSKYVAFGMEINANHVKPARHGFVTGTAKPLHVGKASQVWEIKITDELNDLVCISRLTLFVTETNADALQLS